MLYNSYVRNKIINQKGQHNISDKIHSNYNNIQTHVFRQLLAPGTNITIGSVHANTFSPVLHLNASHLSICSFCLQSNFIMQWYEDVCKYYHIHQLFFF